jgi:cytidylate kinase
MPIITISRGTLSGGEALADRLSQKSGFPVLGLEVIKDAATHYGISESAISQQLKQGPSVIERLVGDNRRTYMIALQSALAERALKASFIYHGLAGHFLFPKVPNILKVRLVAPMAQRIKSVVERKKFNQEEAAKYIENVDEKRKQWTRFLYGVDWTDPMLYDMVINLDQIALDTACGMIMHALAQPEFKDTPEKAKAIQNLALSSQVKAKLALDQRTRGIELDVEANDGRVLVKGHLFTTVTPLATGAQRTKDIISEIAHGVPGVKEITLELK